MAKAPKAQDASDTAIVKALADILDDAGLAELEFENGNMSVRLSASLRDEELDHDEVPRLRPACSPCAQG